MADRFFIAPYDTTSGLQTNVKPWLIPDEAFAELKNAYVFRGRVRKRFGSRWLNNTALQSRLRFNVGVTASGARAGNVRTIAVDATLPLKVGQSFSIADTVFTIVSNVAGPQQMLRSDGSAAVATFDIANGAFNITGVSNGIDVYFYPSFPVMGLLTKEEATTNEEFVIAFDTRYAYQ